MSVLTWLRRRKSVASAVTLAVLVAAPVTIAVIHQGFPISDVDLMAKDVWVTNGSKLLTGRLNMQIEELNGGVSMVSRSFDVMQSGTDVFVYDQDQASIERIDPAYVTLGQTIAVPQGSEVTYGGSSMTIMRPSDGALWIVPTDGELQFNPDAAEPVISLGAGSHAVATLDGVVFAVSAEDGILYRIDSPGAAPVEQAQVAVSDFVMSAVGARAVILDLESNTVITDGGSRIELADPALRIQQPGPARDYAVIATGDSLLKVNFGGSVETLTADISTPASATAAVSAPVVLGSCIHGAWAGAQRYLGVCDGEDAVVASITPGTAGSVLEFRVNRNVIALNNLTDGNVWLVTENMRLVENWEEVTPPAQDESNETDETSSRQSFEDTLAERPEQNRPPESRPDDLGVRPGRTTILDILQNDTDPDGDILTISGVSEVSEAAGVVELIDGGRALQFQPAPGMSGTVSFRYSVTDGRPGGVAESQVNVAIRPSEENLPPVATRSSGVTVEAGQTVTYNTLIDWIDPDGDDLQLTAAEPGTSDVVRFRPDGEITFTNTSSELGQKTVNFTVFDGRESVPGELIVDVKAAGELNPVGTPDFATTFIREPIEISPLDNDRSPSGQPLSLTTVEPLSDGITTSIDLDHGTVTATAGTAGVYYLKYSLAAGAKSSIGIIRVDVLEDPENPEPPIAVKDIAFARPNEPTTLPVLVNDQSPSGRVIGVQSIDLPDGFEQISVEVLNSTVLRITTPSGMTTPADFSYTISDGLNSSTATVTIVPVPELTKHQAPIARDDVIKVRAGDVASVSVLDNDYHPDGARMVLDSELVQADAGDDGLAFVTGSQVRLQAPTEPGQYSVTYRIHDAFEEAAVANVVFTVIAEDAENNEPPLPRTVTARVFQGSSVTIDVPLDGTDPEGDSVLLVGPSGNLLGDIGGQSSTAFTYVAYEDSVGTDQFSYQVQDALGAISTGQIEIGVLPRPDTVLPPSAVLDAISIRPGRVASVPVMANDSDPNGYPISLTPDLLEVQEGITAEVDGEAVVVTAGEDEGTFSLRYQITNGHGGVDDAFVTVTVDKNAPPQYPLAIDHVIEVSEIVGVKTIDVDLLDGAQNPGGLISDLIAEFDGANAASAELIEPGVARITLGDTRQAIAYRLTNEIDELSAMAFVIVPPYTPDLPPVIKPSLVAKPPTTALNQAIQFKLADILDVPSGRTARIINPETVSAGRSNGAALTVDEFTLSYAPEQDFRGETSITFEVTDGDSADDASGNRAILNLRIIVGDANFEDVAPTFSNSTVSIEAGEAATVIDLVAASAHPNPDVRSQLTYKDLSGATSSIGASIAGDSLTVSAPFGVQPGSSATLAFTVNYKSFSVPAQIQVNVVASTRPLAQTVDDVEPEGRSSSTYTIQPLANDFNPFASDGKALTIVSAEFEGANLGASLSSTASSVTVKTGTAKSGTISVIYTVRDATNAAAREVQGRITVVVASAPEPVTSVSLTNPGSRTVDLVFAPPSSSNGAEITGYTVQMTSADGNQSRTDCAPGATCRFTGLANGAPHNFTVSATNKVGTTLSNSSSITPWGTPSAPTNPTLSTSSSTANATVTPSWSSPADTGGGQITYTWTFIQGSSATNSTGETSGTGQYVGEGDYAFQVQACNPGGCSPTVQSGSVHISAPPARAWVTRDGNTVTYHWENFTAGMWAEVNTFRCYNVPPNQQQGTANIIATAPGAFTPGNGSVSIPCGTGVTDNYSIEPWKFGPWLKVGGTWQ